MKPTRMLFFFSSAVAFLTTVAGAKVGSEGGLSAVASSDAKALADTLAKEGHPHFLQFLLEIHG